MKVKSLSRIRLLATPRTVAYQAPPSMGFSRQENRLVQKDMQQTVQFLIKSWKEPKVHEHITDYINYNIKIL